MHPLRPVCRGLEARSPHSSPNIQDLERAIGKDRFDIVVCSEVIEHTQDPALSVRQLVSVLKPGGMLAISCPNRKWIFLLHLVQILGLRKHYQGFENWLWPKELLKLLETSGMTIERKVGIRLVPWHFLPKKFAIALDRATSKWNYYWTVNLAVLAKKKIR